MYLCVCVGVFKKGLYDIKIFYNFIIYNYTLCHLISKINLYGVHWVVDVFPHFIRVENN